MRIEANLQENPALKDTVYNLLEKVRGTPHYVQLVRKFQLTDQGPGLLELAAAKPRDAAGVDAMRLLLSGSHRELLGQTLAQGKQETITPLVEAMGHTAKKEAVPLLSPLLKNASLPLALRRKAVHALAQTIEGAGILLQLARKNELPDDLKLVTGAELSAVRWSNIREQAAKILPPPKAGNADPLPPVSELARLTGDTARGEAVYFRAETACANCHKVRGRGTDIGPDLSEIGGKLGKDALYDAIREPSAGISFGYEAWTIELVSGEDVYGLIVSESENELAVKNPGGVVSQFKKSEIARREKSALSLMPAGLQSAMSRQDLVDLVEFLAALKKAN